MRKKNPSTLNHVSAAAMMRCLLVGDASVPEIVLETGISACTVRRYVNALRKARVIHVSGWDCDTMGRRSLAAYSIGDKQDAKKSPLRGVDRARAYRRRMRELSRAVGAFAESRARAPEVASA